MPLLNFLVEALLIGAAVAASILTRGWIHDVGRPPYQEFLRLQWLLVQGGKGLNLDPASLPLAPSVYVGVAAIAGRSFAETWLPVLLDVSILFVLTHLLLADRPLVAKLVAGLLLVASPLFYLLQRQLDVQIYVLLLGLQLVSLRSFREKPSVLAASVAIAINLLMSMTTYMALPAIIAAILYLLITGERQNDVRAPIWGALMWLYVPFSFAAYALWGVFWAIAGSRVTTSYFIPSTPGSPSYLEEMLHSLRSDVAVPLIALFALVLASAIFLRHRIAAPKGGRQNLSWVVASFMAFVLCLLAMQTITEHLPFQLEVFWFSLLLLVPLALAEMHEQARSLYHELSRPARAGLLLSFVLLAAIPLHSLARAGALEDGVPPADDRQAAEQQAADAFLKNDPGGRILIDPRFTATFVDEAHIDPHRLTTPFDDGFAHQVVSPPDDVQVIVVTDSLNDDVAGNYPGARFSDLLPNATLIAQGKADGKDGPVFVRVFRREHFAEPTQNAPTIARDPAITTQENTILQAIMTQMQTTGGLPIRPDGYAYGIDLGNLMVYSAELGDIKLFTYFSNLVQQDYLVTKSDDVNALYTVAWRYKPGTPNDASGTTETLRMIEAYWTAGERWNNDYYRRLAYLMAKAYSRHQWSDQYGQGWYIRNYYNYGTKEYANNSYLVDYNPDILRKVADYMNDKDLRAVADASANFVTSAQLPSGLVQEMYQPEISTLYANVTYFSPNGIVQLIDSVESILGVSQLYAPDKARLTYNLAEKEFYSTPAHALSNQYLLDGTSTGGQENAPAVYAYLVRLGLRLGDTTWPRQLIDTKLQASQLFAAPTPVNKDFNWYFAWTSSLLALRDYQQSQP